MKPLLLFLVITTTAHAQYLRPHAPEWDEWTFSRTENSGGHLSSFWWMFSHGTDDKILFPVYNWDGRRVGTIANTRYDVSHLKAGVYFVIIHEQSFKFIKQ